MNPSTSPTGVRIALTPTLSRKREREKCPVSPGNGGEGRGRGGAFETHAPSPPSGIGLQADARTASEGAAGTAAEQLVAQRALPGHAYWPDDISLPGAGRIDASRLLISGQVTDSYLLALASAHDGQVASFGRRLVTAAVPGGARCLHLID